MGTNEELRISIDLIKHFYQEIIKECNSIDELRKKGELWIAQINKKYNSKTISDTILDILLVELLNFGKKQAINYNALVMKGGGIKGIAYVGALEELLKHYEFNWYAGTSAGAVTAILLGSGHTVEELKTILSQKDFNDFKDTNLLKAIFINMIFKKGLYEANSFNEWLEELLALKLDSSVSVEMRDLIFRTTVFASRKDKSVQVFDSHKADSQNFVATFAARCSMSIPIFFTPQQIDGRNVLDGGVKNNFPVELILQENENTNFVGLYLGNRTFKNEKKSLIKDLLQIWTESNDSDILRKYKEQIIIIDPHPISTLKFKLNDIEKEFLLESGRLAALNFLDKNKFINKNESNYENRVSDLEITRGKIIIQKKRKKNKYILIVIFLLLVLICWCNFKKIQTLWLLIFYKLLLITR